MNKIRLINVAEKQKKLTQEIIKLILEKKFSTEKSQETDSRILSVKQEFESTLNILKRERNISQEVLIQLFLVEEKWAEFMNSSKIAPIESVIEKNGDVLVEMDKAVSLYKNLVLSIPKCSKPIL